MEDKAGEPAVIEESSAPRFSAFISYSHTDAAKVRKLHSQIEAYRLPKDIGSIDTLNRKGRSLGKIFRDREDLSAAEDLSKAVKDALNNSQVLVVACSPDAKASQWVDQEIAYFRERHPDRPILAAILRGEPSEAFPAALTEGGAEPLAADLRKQGDGWKLGFLKVVAGIAGVPLDRLVQRDSQRQLRRVTAVTGLVAAIAIVMGVMTTIALQARDEAETRRVEAETLRKSSDAFIDELLTDGRQDLQGVGRLDVLDKFNQRALRFYERQGDIADLPPDSLQMWARILHVIGEDETITQDDNGEIKEPDLSKALSYFQAAHGATAELLQREPDNPDRIYGHAQSVYWVGRIDELRRKFSAAEPYYQKYRQMGLRLEELEPGTHRSAMERGWGELNLGILAFEQRDLALAGSKFDEAISWFDQAVSLKPSDRDTQEALANAYSWRFHTFFDQEDFENALEQRLLSIEIIQRSISSNPDDLELQFSLLIARRAIAMTRKRLGKIKDAQAELREVGEEIDSLLKHDPKNREWSEFSQKISNDLSGAG